MPGLEGLQEFQWLRAMAAHLLRRHGVSRAPGCTRYLARYIGERPLQLGGRRATADERGSIATQYKRDEVEVERPRGVDATPEPGLTRRVRREPECSVQAPLGRPPAPRRQQSRASARTTSSIPQRLGPTRSTDRCSRRGLVRLSRCHSRSALPVPPATGDRRVSLGARSLEHHWCLWRRFSTLT